jgi:hypothetical protein
LVAPLLVFLGAHGLPNGLVETGPITSELGINVLQQLLYEFANIGGQTPITIVLLCCMVGGVMRDWGHEIAMASKNGRCVTLIAFKRDVAFDFFPEIVSGVFQSVILGEDVTTMVLNFSFC